MNQRKTRQEGLGGKGKAGNKIVDLAGNEGIN